MKAHQFKRTGYDVPVNITYNGLQENTADSTTQRTFTAVAMGTDTPDRIVAVFVSFEGLTDINILSVTIDGVTATRAYTDDGEYHASSGSLWGSWYYTGKGEVTGTTADIVVDWTDANTRRGGIVFSYSIYNAQPTPTVYYNNTAYSTTVSPAPSVTGITIPAKGGAIGGGANTNYFNNNPNITNLTEDASDGSVGGDDSMAVVGSREDATEVTGLTVSFTYGTNFGGSGIKTGMVLVWSPI